MTTLAGENAQRPGVLPKAEASRPPAGRRVRRPWWDFKRKLPLALELPLGLSAWLIFIAAWFAVVGFGWVNERLVPPPDAVVAAWWELIAERGFAGDILASVKRIAISFAIAAAVAIPLGVLMGAFKIVEAFFNPLVAPARYLPAPAFVPLLLMWFGTGDGQKIALLVIGVVWFLLALVMDHTKNGDAALIEASRTLGANRWQVLRKVVWPEVLPHLVTAMRQMLAVSWTYLVIAEIVAATDGIGAMMMRARRFVRTDDIMAGILTIGMLGLLFDLLFRAVHRLAFRYLYTRG